MGKVAINGEPSHKRFDMRTYISAKTREDMFWWRMRRKIKLIFAKNKECNPMGKVDFGNMTVEQTKEVAMEAIRNLHNDEVLAVLKEAVEESVADEFAAWLDNK